MFERQYLAKTNPAKQKKIALQSTSGIVHGVGVSYCRTCEQNEPEGGATL